MELVVGDGYVGLSALAGLYSETCACGPGCDGARPLAFRIGERSPGSENVRDHDSEGRQAGLVGAGGAFAGLDFFEEPDGDDADEAEDGGPAEDVDEGPVGG